MNVCLAIPVTSTDDTTARLSWDKNINILFFLNNPISVSHTNFTVLYPYKHVYSPIPHNCQQVRPKKGVSNSSILTHLDLLAQRLPHHQSRHL